MNEDRKSIYLGRRRRQRRCHHGDLLGGGWEKNIATMLYSSFCGGSSCNKKLPFYQVILSKH